VERELRLSVDELFHKVEHIHKKHEADTQSLIIRKDELSVENKRIKEDIEEVRRAKAEVECRLE
jgi:hypothetical protein